MLTTHLPNLTFAIWMPGTTEMIVILIIGLLIFGRRLPEVGRSLGKGIVEFKRGIKGIEDDIDDESNRDQSSNRRLDQQGPNEIPHHLDQQRQQQQPAAPATSASSSTTGEGNDNVASQQQPS